MKSTLKEFKAKICRKVISVPIGDQIVETDITELIPIIDHPHFQRLRHISQLTASNVVYPEAEHKRFSHSLTVMETTRQRVNLWKKLKMIALDDAWNLVIYASVHDIGHGPLSHIMDRISKTRNHDQNGRMKIQEMKSEIEACNGSIKKVTDLFDEKNPLYQAVMHHPLGTDKFSYLSQDADHCISTGRPNIGKLSQYIYWYNNELIVDPKVVGLAMDLQRFYIMMYREVYFRKAATIANRLLEKMILILIKDGLDEDTLWEMKDSNLEVMLEKSQNKRVKKIYNLWQNRKFKAAVSFRPLPFGSLERTVGKSIEVFEEPQELFEIINKQSSPEELEKKEKKLAKILNLKQNDIIIVPPVPGWRFSPPSIKSINIKEQIYEVDEIFPRHRDALNELARACTVLRVCASTENRDCVYSKAELVREFIENWVY